MIKYVLHPGTVVSKVDGDLHFITAAQLAQLYGVRFDECIARETFEARECPAGLIHLYPRFDGNYTLPKEIT